MGKVVSLGEIMMRASTPNGNRLNDSSSLAIHYGGGEANVAISLANFGHEAYFASKVPRNSLGKAALQHLQKYDVQTNYLLYGGDRLGLYFMESGSGPRGASVIYDRAHSSFSSMSTVEWEVSAMFQETDVFHISGITPALSKKWEELTLYLIMEARNAGCKISFDCNFRTNLWTQKQAKLVFKKIMPFIDYCSAGELDARYLFDIPEFSAEKEEEPMYYYYQQMHNVFPNVIYFYSTKRKIFSANHHQLQGTLWSAEGYVESKNYEIEPIIDRVGTGDAFSAGLLHSLLVEKEPQEAIEFATAASVLKHTVPGDCNQFTEKEVDSFLKAKDPSKIAR